MTITGVPASRPSIRNSEGLTFTSSVNEDDDVAVLEKESKAVEVDIFFVIAVVTLVVGLGVLVFNWGSYSPRQSELSREIQRWCVGSFFIAISVWSFNYSHMLNKDYEAEKKRMRRSIASSRKIAQSLGSDKVPVLTKEHVEKRVQIDTALKDELDARGKKWDQSESDSIAVLLFQDLLMESVILALINERGLVTSADISSALKQMESESIKPIQDGWL